MATWPTHKAKRSERNAFLNYLKKQRRRERRASKKNEPRETAPAT